MNVHPISSTEKEATQSFSEISQDVDDLLNMATDTEEPNTVKRKPKHKIVRLATHSNSNGTEAVKRKCQRAMIAGKGTSSGKLSLRLFGRIQKVIFQSCVNSHSLQAIA